MTVCNMGLMRKLGYLNTKDLKVTIMKELDLRLGSFPECIFKKRKI